MASRSPSRLSAQDATVPFAPWRKVFPTLLRNWEQGEHFVTLGKTGRGKTTLEIALMEGRHRKRRAKVCSMVVKRRDETSAKLVAKGWHRIYDWPPGYAARRSGKIILWPSYTRASTYAKDRRSVFVQAFDEIIEEGNWTLCLDEASYMVESMRIRTSIDELFTQSRSNGITLIAGSQRPVWVSRSMVSQHCWVACFRIGDTTDARRAGEVLGDKDRYAPVIQRLGPHEFVLANTITDEAIVTQVGS